jgi:hypothetical protein
VPFSRSGVGFAKARDWVVEQAGLELTATVDLLTPGNVALIATVSPAETPTVDWARFRAPIPRPNRPASIVRK